MMPRAEMVHWWFAGGTLMLGLLSIAQLVAGPDVWAMRAWRRYLWPGLLFAMGVLMWPVMTFYTNSTIHMMLAGGAELGVTAGKLHSPYWRLCSVGAMLVSGTAFLVHEQQAWFFSRAAFLHHSLGWTLIVGAIFPLVQAFRPRSLVAGLGFASVFLLIAVQLFSDRDTAAIFGHLSQFAGVPHR